jgi:uncharacterized protein YndB with AHSA1/START domain
MNTIERTQTHATFVLERDYDASLERVWQAFADEEAKKKWFGGEDEGWTITESVHDFRVGGRDVNVGTFEGSMESRFVGTYTDIVPNERIVYSYDMWVNGAHLSTSVTTITFEESAGGTHLTFTEQGVFLDNADNPAQREEGTSSLLDLLGASLAGGS